MFRPPFTALPRRYFGANKKCFALPHVITAVIVLLPKGRNHLLLFSPPILGEIIVVQLIAAIDSCGKRTAHSEWINVDRSPLSIRNHPVP